MTSSQILPAEVTGLANRQLEKADSEYRLSRRLQLGTLALGIISIFIKSSYAYIPVLAAFLTQAYSWILRNRAGQLHGVGEEGRRFGLLLDALGYTGARIEMANWFSKARIGQGEAPPDPVALDYFASSSTVGLRRLCDHLQENSFWGKHLYKATSSYYGRLLWFSLGGVIVAVLISIPVAHGGQGLILARVLIASLASGAAVTQLGDVMSWKSAETKSDALYRRLEALSAASETMLQSDYLPAILSAYGDYCVATAAAPPVPKFLYLRERDRINGLWGRHSGAI